MSNLDSLKKTSSISKLTKLAEAVSKTSKKSYEKDDRYWSCKVDKAGNGFAVIRFLDSPVVDGEDGLPFIQMFDHGFEGPGGWYIEKSLTTIGKEDPVGVYNRKLWDSKIEANIEQARNQKRRLKYISNILVVKDPAAPENEGKVFLFSYGKKIYEKLRQAFNPTPEEIDAAALEGINLVPVDVFNLWNGHNFRLKVKKVEGFPNYDESSLEGLATADGPAKGTPITKTDKEIEKIFQQAYSLKDFHKPENFKSYEELESRLNRVLGLNMEQKPSKVLQPNKALSEDEDNSPPWNESPKKVETSDDDEEMLKMFQKLAEEA